MEDPFVDVERFKPTETVGASISAIEITRVWTDCRKASTVRILDLLSVVVGLLLFTGCQSDATITPVPPAVLNSVVTYFAARFSWNLASRIDVHKAFFVRRRAKHLGETHAAWVTETNQTTLKARIESEYNELLSYLTFKLGTPTTPGPLAGGAGDLNPPHVNLRDVARTKINTSTGTANRRANNFLDLRKQRVRTITWRAAGIHDGLWQTASDQRSATLRQAAMTEILDRRLRCVERMSFNVSRADASGLGEDPTWQVAGNHGPWRDRFRVRMFEYPRVRNIPLFRNAINPANIAPSSVPVFADPAGREWRESLDGRRLEYNVPPWPGNRQPPAQAPNWLNTPAAYTLAMRQGAVTASAMIDAMFTPDENWWERTWAFCDHVLAALNLEALRFALQRRTGSDSTFDALLTARPAGYVALAANVGAAGPVDQNRLMADDADPFFENILVPVEDLQVGDQLIFWNSFVYSLISDGDWRLENAFVMNVNSNNQGGVQINSLALQGHGTAEKQYPAYRNEIVGHFQEALDHVRTTIAAAVAANPAVDRLDFRGSTDRLIKWTPYEPFNSPGAWWVRVEFRGWGSAASALAAVGKSVAHDTSPGPGYTAPLHNNDSVFFPIFEPAITGGWPAYMAQRRANAAFRAPRRLRPVHIDGSLTPGVHFRGQTFPIAVVRPRVRP